MLHSTALVLRHILTHAIAHSLIAIAGFIESVVAAKQQAQRFNYTISPNRESVALGIGNLVSSFLPGEIIFRSVAAWSDQFRVVGTIPAYGAVTRYVPFPLIAMRERLTQEEARSRVNADCGSTTQMASLITSSLVVLSIFFLLPALYFLPSCVLAAVCVLLRSWTLGTYVDATATPL